MKTAKIILPMMLTLCGFSAQAQMTEALSSLAIQGEIAREGYKTINQGQQAVNRLQFQQDLATLITEIQTSHMGNYHGISKEQLSARGIRGVNWNVAEDGPDGFVINLDGIDSATCFICKGTDFGYHKIDINGRTECDSATNDVKMYFY